MKLELALALYQSAQCLSVAIAIFLAVLAIGVFVFNIDDAWSSYEKVAEKGKKMLKYALRILIAAFVFTVFASLPGIEDLYKVRISLIKYEMSSPENVKGAVETIERIGAKLECKYFGCKDDKK